MSSLGCEAAVQNSISPPEDFESGWQEEYPKGALHNSRCLVAHAKNEGRACGKENHGVVVAARLGLQVGALWNSSQALRRRRLPSVGMISPH